MDGKLVKVAGNRLVLETSEGLNLSRVNHLSEGQQPSVEFTIVDQRKISRDQRAKIWALIHDLCDYTGDTPDYWEAEFKWRVQTAFGIQKFSLSDCSVTTANRMILVILDFLFSENIPFKTEIWDSLPQEFPKQILCLRNRQCVICGKPNADLAHFKTVGLGRNRHKIDERKMYFFTLCREHHQEQHAEGINSFIQKYHIKPVRLSNSDLIRFKILTRHQLEKLEKNDGIQNF